MADHGKIKCDDGDLGDEEDRISQLPSCVLSHVLSFMSMKNAARTSVLSKHWRRRWLCVDEFYFDIGELFKDEVSWLYTCDVPVLMVEYVEWVSKVLCAHHDAMLEIDGEDSLAVIKKLRIRMPLSESFQEYLDEWISYAFARKVKSLELKLASQYGQCCFHSRLIKGNLDCLVSLSLVGVNVTGEDVEVFLRKFKYLEYLKLCMSDTLISVEVCGSHPALKHMEILDCPNIQCVILRNTRLASLTITWLNVVVLENNTKLAALRAGGWSRHSPTENLLKQLSSCFSSLETLTLDANYYDETEVFDEVPQLSQLKELTLISDQCPITFIHRFTALLILSPKLEKFILEFGEMYVFPGMMKEEGPMIHLQHLKAIEVRGYFGYHVENEILLYFFKHVLAPMKTVTFDPKNLHRDMPTPSRSPPNDMTVDDRVVLLRKVIPSFVELIVV